MDETTNTLDELVARTGFSKRQIRYYITRKLVPGAGTHRGPHAVYGAETLRRLLAIAALKDQPVGPTGRRMTLAEIRYELEQDRGPLEPATRGLVLKCAKFVCASPEPEDFGLAEPDDDERSRLRDLLWRLHSLLSTVGLDTRGDCSAGNGENWRRLTSPEVEIQVRVPDTKRALWRLDRMAEELGDLLTREDRDGEPTEKY